MCLTATKTQAADTSSGLRGVTAADVDFVLQHVRSADFVEWQLMCPAPTFDLRSMIIESVNGSAFSASAYYGDQIVVILGITQPQPESNTAKIWAIGTTALERPEVYMRWVKASIQIIETFGKQFERLENVVHEKNKKAIRYLRHLDFEFTEPAVTIKNEVFLPFHKTAVKVQA
ncbi:hypothetical protein K3725_12205 [Leisingera sp. S132]|uniref:hypothetical protein n=1 Tax=Leisingera sp. S132 TaxID=2867016 RepID=UPI0021A29326|nr:hypothetical protein [Leisingera sp. S132]UWQ78076.1 hypothetical protein K3725_12205 [Leisingera sp. S132]